MKKTVTCPVCDQTLTDDATAHVHAPDGLNVLVPLSYLVDQQNQMAALSRENADLRFTIIDHEDD